MTSKKNFKATENPTMQFITTDAPEPQPLPKIKAPLEEVAIPEGYRLIRESKTARLQLLVRPQIKDGLQEVAEAEGLSLNELCSQVFENFLKARAGTT